MAFNVIQAAHDINLRDVGQLNQPGIEIRYKYEIGFQQRITECVNEVTSGRPFLFFVSLTLLVKHAVSGGGSARTVSPP